MIANKSWTYSDGGNYALTYEYYPDGDCYHLTEISQGRFRRIQHMVRENAEQEFLKIVNRRRRELVSA